MSYKTKAIDKLINQTIEDLKREGKRIVNECLSEANYRHQTLNLHDSYGCAIYKFGKKVFQFIPPKLATESHLWEDSYIEGSEEIAKFISGYKASSKSIEMVVVAAMPYAEYLEKGWTYKGNKYKVISMAYDKLKALSSKFEGSSIVEILQGQKV